MKIKPLDTKNKPVFKMNSPLKDAYLSGRLKLKQGIYGGEITPDTFSHEHLQPVSKGGKNNIGNLAIANKQLNSKRGNRPLIEFFNKEAFEKYCKTIEEQHLPELKGYVKKIKETVNRVLKRGL